VTEPAAGLSGLSPSADLSKLVAIFRAFGRFDFKQLIALVSGSKIDGSQEA